MSPRSASMEAGASRVVSRDGTEIAYWTSGEGPPLLLVHGVSGDHARWGPLLPHLESHASVHTMDRRGRGGSGDAPQYRLSREFEDVAAVADAVAKISGSAVDVYGHSFGGLCAFGAATLTSKIRRLVLYEGWPPVDPSVWTLPQGIEQRLDASVAGGDRDEALQTFMREVVMMPDEEIAILRAQPAWAGRLSAAHTITREFRALLETSFDPEEAGRITVPTLLVTGSDSHDPAAAEVGIVAAALPDARITVLEGQTHVADTLAPDVFAGPMIEFLRES